ncbi:MAG: alpha/beta fold hydrolase [Omnitrophica WOR_2 bacterium]
MITFALIHSPLVGPFTWTRVYEELKRMGFDPIAPVLLTGDDLQPPYWKRHAEIAAHALKHIPAGQDIVLVGHSGAGMLLPSIRDEMECPVSAYIFVDAGIPENMKSRLDLFGSTEADDFRRSAVAGYIPAWTEDDLHEVIPDAQLRQRFVTELHPTPLLVYEEPVPVFEGWPDAPCGYIQFSPVYDKPAEFAREKGWGYRRLDGGHFHMLVDPQAVTAALIDLVEGLNKGKIWEY